MSVPVHERRQSKLEVFHHWYEFRQTMMSELLYDFGFSKRKFEKNLLHKFGVKDITEIKNEDEINHYDREMHRAEKFEDWMIYSFRYKVIDIIFDVGVNIARANSIYPIYYSEFLARREYQTKAIGSLYALDDLMYWIITTISTDVNRYTRISKSIHREINLLKSWRKSDKKRFGKIQPETFADLVNAYRNMSNGIIDLKKVELDDIGTLNDNTIIAMTEDEMIQLKENDQKALDEVIKNQIA